MPGRSSERVCTRAWAPSQGAGIHTGPPALAYSSCTPVGRVRFGAPTELPASPAGGSGPLRHDHQSNRKEVQPRLPRKASLF